MHDEPFTAPWIAAWRERLTASAAFRALAADWDATLVASAGARAAYLELGGGACREARIASAEDRATARFVLAAEAAVWERLFHGELDPAAAVMSGALRIERGGFLALLPFVPAARQLLAEAAAVETTPATWRGER